MKAEIYIRLKNLKDAFEGKAKLGVRRSSEWPRVRKEHIEKNPSCVVCGGTDKLEVHHIIPFHQDPSRELDPDNLLTMCESGKSGIVCHRAFGHLSSYRSYNPNVREDAASWLKRIKERP